MHHRFSKRIIHHTLILAALCAPLAACGDDASSSAPDAAIAPPPPPPPPAPSVKLTTRGAFGPILTDADGKTLYTFGKDFPASGTTAAVPHCTGACLTAWPVFHAAGTDVGTGLDKADFGEITLTGGAEQTTYKGWPLYYFATDATAGDTKGDDINHLFFVVRDPFTAVLVMGSPNATGPAHYLADARGFTLYMRSTDTVGTATTPPTTSCTGDCATAWPAFKTDATAVPTGVDALTSFDRPDGGKQLAWRGHPLYFFHTDATPGDVEGNGVAMFAVVDPTVAAQ